MSPAHTPGPWFVGHVGMESLWVGPDAQSPFVCTVPWDCDGSRDNARDNARLISAAPDLLEALEDLLDEYIRDANDLGDPDPEDSPYVKFARAAIAKATGAAQ